MTFSDIYKVLDLHFSRADKAADEISRIQLDAHTFDDFEAVKTIDTFIYRFSKIQDYMGEKLFPVVLDMLGEYKSSLSFMDILNKLERLEFIQSVRQWINFREIRNTLTHEYPDNEKEIIEGIKLAVNAYSEIKNIYATINKRL
ncbi:MAG: hypothetical protein PF482_19480 [Desulfobacteraceae bacterium]|jgi:hypothetical protein|nr:hypothetical protein [Desulfobacteraceae bacterium]